MTADVLEYGWYKWENGFRQKDGFFVDRAGNVLYWPTRRGAGYVMDDAAIEAVVQHRERQEKVATRGRFLAVLLWIVLYFLLDESIRRYFDLYLMPVFALIFATALEKIRGAVILRQRGLDLSHRPRVDRRRPAGRDALVVAKALPRDEFRMAVAGRVILALFVIAIGVHIYDWTVGKWFSGVSAEDLLEQGFWWSLGVLVFLQSAWRITVLLRARNAPIDAWEVRGRIKVKDGLKGRRLWHEEDLLEVPEDLQLRDDPQTRPLRRYDRL